MCLADAHEFIKKHREKVRQELLMDCAREALSAPAAAIPMIRMERREKTIARFTNFFGTRVVDFVAVEIAEEEISSGRLKAFTVQR